MSQAPTTLALTPTGGRGLQLTSLDDMMRFARIVLTSGLAPKSFDTAEKVVIALVTGLELGISAMQSLQGLAVTNGRIGVMGDLALALCQASPDFEDYQEDWFGTEGADDWGCRITVKRKGQTPKVGQFTVLDARRANLWNKRGRDGAATPWVTYPQRMLRYRALGFVLRDAFPDVLKGVKTVEELQDYPNEEPRNGFNHAKPVEGNVVESEPKQSESSPVPPAATSNGNDHADKAPAATAEGQTITGMVERAWPNDYQGKRYYFAKVNGQQLQTTDREVGEALITQIGKEIRAQVDPSSKPGKWYLQSFEPVMTPPPAAAKPEPKVIENPGMDAVARKKARDAAKERLAKEGVKEPQASEATANEEIPREGDSDWQRVRKLVTEGDTSEYWTLKAAQHLGLVSPEVKRLTDVQPGVLQEIINRWSVVLKAAKEREVA